MHTILTLYGPSLLLHLVPTLLFYKTEAGGISNEIQAINSKTYCVSLNHFTGHVSYYALFQ